MKNKHIKNLSQVVPPQIRVEVYEEAIKRTQIVVDDYDNKDNVPFGYSVGLCLLLPICLWDLRSCHGSSPDNDVWSYHDTGLAFPELGDNLELLKQRIDDNSRNENTRNHNRLQIRIDFLKKFIQQIQNTDTNENSIN